MVQRQDSARHKAKQAAVCPIPPGDVHHSGLTACRHGSAFPTAFHSMTTVFELGDAVCQTVQQQTPIVKLPLLLPLYPLLS